MIPYTCTCISKNNTRQSSKKFHSMPYDMRQFLHNSFIKVNALGHIIFQNDLKPVLILTLNG